MFIRKGGEAGRTQTIFFGRDACLTRPQRFNSVTRRGATLIEILVVCGIVVMALGTWIYFRISAGAIDKNSALDQDYYYKKASLMAKLRHDIRSSVKIRESQPGNYSLQTVALDENGIPRYEEVSYQVLDQGKKIRRITVKNSETFDFSDFLGGKSFVFKIECSPN